MERKLQLFQQSPKKNHEKYVHGVFSNPFIPFKTTLFCIECQISFYEGDDTTLGNIAAQQIAMQHDSALHHTIYRATNEPIL